MTAPARVVAQAVNYRSHATDSGFDPDAVPAAFFRKASHSITGPAGDIIRPDGVGFLDYEVELGLVIGTDLPVGTTVTEADLARYVAALVVADDVSARQIQLVKTQFYESKSYPTFTPVGPWLTLVDAADLARLGSLRLTLSVNGQVRQDSTTADMIVRPAQALTLLSRFQPMAPGDLLLTGTPGGTALKAPAKIAGMVAGLLPPATRWKLFFSAAGGQPPLPARRRRHHRDDRLARRAARPRHPAQHHYREAAMTTREILPQPESTYQLLLDAARTWPDGMATQWIPDPGDYTRCLAWTYAELAGTVTRIANALTALGVRREDAVTLASVNTSMLYAATLAAQAVGIAAPVNPALSGERIAELIRRTGSRVLVAAGPELDPQLWQRLLGVARQAGMTAVLALRPDGAHGDPPALDGDTSAGVHSALGLPAHDRFQIGQRIVSVANGFTSFKSSLFKLMLFLAGRLPILLSQVLQFRFSRLKLEIGDHLYLHPFNSYSKTAATSNKQKLLEASSTTATTATTASSSRPICRNEPPASQPASVHCAS